LRPGFAGSGGGYPEAMRIGRNLEARPLGGAPGCVAMLVASVVISVVLNVLLNLVVR